MNPEQNQQSVQPPVPQQNQYKETTEQKIMRRTTFAMSLMAMITSLVAMLKNLGNMFKK